MGFKQTAKHKFGKGSYHQIGLVRGQFGNVNEADWLDFIAKAGFDGWEEASWELDLRRWVEEPVELPAGYRLLAWDPVLARAHGDVKFRCFQHELDANIFPCFTSHDGCCRLMREISQREGFVPQATWLLVHTSSQGAGPQGDDYCGTIQSVREAADLASLQNIGITPEHRGRGLGTVLIQRAIAGLREAGLNPSRIHLEIPWW